MKHELDNKYISLLNMESAADGSSQERINLLILTSIKTLKSGNDLKNKITQANNKRYKQILVSSYSEFEKK